MRTKKYIKPRKVFKNNDRKKTCTDFFLILSRNKFKIENKNWMLKIENNEYPKTFKTKKEMFQFLGGVNKKREVSSCYIIGDSSKGNFVAKYF